MRALESLYRLLPIPLQELAVSWAGWRTLRTRYAPPFPEILAELEARGRCSSDEIRSFRDRRLRAFVLHAATSVPYYQRMFSRLGVAPESIATLEDLAKLPPLRRSEAQEHGGELVSQAPGLGRRVKIHTSGTTGAGLRLLTTQRAIQEQWAVYWRYWRWHGIERGTLCGLFAGRTVVPREQEHPPFWRVSPSTRQIAFSSYHMSETNLDAYVDELRSARPPWLHGYPSALTLLARHLGDRGHDLGYVPRWITVASETLSPSQARLLETAFGVRPRQHYGNTEAVANFSECDRGALHVDEDFAAVEFAPEGAGTYRVVGSNLSNLRSPLLRYETSDLVTLGDPCACGRPGRVVSSIDGRIEDYVVLRDGTRIGRLDHILKDLGNVREAQVYQESPGAVVFRIVRGPRYARADEERILSEARLRLGAGTDITVDYRDELPRGKSGKLRFVISKVGARPSSSEERPSRAAPPSTRR